MKAIAQWTVLLIALFIAMVAQIAVWAWSLAFGDYVKPKDRKHCGDDT